MKAPPQYKNYTESRPLGFDGCFTTQTIKQSNLFISWKLVCSINSAGHLSQSLLES